MYIDFSKIDFKKRPNFILKDMDLNALATLSHVINPTGNLSFSEISEISFKYPEYDNGKRLEEYDLLTDMRVLDVEGYGQFVMRNCQVEDDGIIAIKNCIFYSLDYEFTMKSVFLAEGTYNFWNPFASNGTIIQMILDAMPSWKLSSKYSFPSDLIGKYRTLSVDNVSIYDFIKSDLQQKYGCIIDFDTYNREIIVKSAFAHLTPKPVYISNKNLAKEIEIDTRTDEIITVLDVNGADGVDIRSVNPMGTNRIYNLDQYMNTDYFSQTIINKWNAWKANYESYQQTYYDLVIEQQMQISRYQTELAALGTLNGEMQTLESQRAVIIQAIANDSALQSDLAAINRQISAKQTEINSKSNAISQIESSIQTLTNRLKAINTLTSFEAFFNSNELLTLDKYFRCGTLTDSSFVATEIESYGTDATTKTISSAIFNLTNLTTLRRETHDGNMAFYTVRGGKIQESGTGFSINANIVNGTLQVNNDNSFVFSLYLSSGTVNGEKFPNATFSMTGTMTIVTMPDSETLQFRVSNSTAYLTQAVTEYQKMSIEWELYEYGVKSLSKMSTPTYSFNVSSINFLTLDDFATFAKQFSLGEQLYLHIKDQVYHPIAISVSIEFDNPESLEINFGDEYHYQNNDMTYQDLIELSASMGNSLDFNQFNYSNFVNSGAQTSVKSFMESAIDTMRNAILSGNHNEMTIDPTGLRMRKYDESTGDYSPKQIWMAHNALMFTSNNWTSAEIGIGEFVDKNLGSLFGIVAPALVGTILAGSQLVIESEKTDGGVVVFKVDAEGASLHNASFNLYGSSGGRIDLGATLGIVVGTDRNTMMSYNAKGNPTGVKTKNGRTITRISNLTSGDEPIPNLWADMFGDLWLRGRIYATDGIFNGTVYATAGEFTGKVTATSGKFNGIVQASQFLDSLGRDMMSQESGKFNAEYLNLKGLNVNNRFIVDSNGNVTITNGSISWSAVTGTSEIDQRIQNAQNTANSAYDYADDAYAQADAAYDVARKIANGEYSGTFIDGDKIYSPNIYANQFSVMPRTVGNTSGGYSIYGYWGRTLYHFFNLSYYGGGDAPYVNFGSPSGAYANWNFSNTYFSGNIYFTTADVYFNSNKVHGLDTTATFG